jgi:hypothetical protein
MTSEPPTTRISERRAQGPRTDNPHTSEPTVELRIKPAEKSAPAGDHPTPSTARADDRPTPSTAPTGDRPRPSAAPAGNRPPPSPAPAGRWWSGQPDDDDTVTEPATWAEEPTVERTAEQPTERRGTHPAAAEPNRIRPDDETRVERRSGLFRRRRSN